MEQANPPSPSRHWKRWFIALFVITVVVPGLVAIGLLSRFGGDTPVDYASAEDHFKYGSTGGEHVSGFPYWIWQAMPQVCAEHLPGKGYASLGLIYEQDSAGTLR